MRTEPFPSLGPSCHFVVCGRAVAALMFEALALLCGLFTYLLASRGGGPGAGDLLRELVYD